MQRTLPPLGAIAAGLALSACSMAPKYIVPPVPLAEQYKEAAGQKDWQPAQPGDTISRGSWWQAYGDSTLDRLADQLERNSPDLAAALARYEQSNAYYQQTRSAYFPSLSLGGQYQPNRGSDMRPPSGNSNRYYDNDSLGLAASYELDLWGRVRNTVKAGRADLAAAAADLESAHLSLRAELVDDYLQLRGTDQTVQLLTDTVDAYQRALELTQTRRQGGIGSGLDVARAQTQLKSAQAQLATTQAQRAVLEHAIAILVGASPSTFSIAPDTTGLTLPNVPTDVPSTLLQRRPDIAAAERRTAAANAAVGVARAAWFPSLTLGGTVGYSSYEGSDWFQASNLFWSIGPTLAVDLFDGGKRKAQVRQARAALDEAGASYRSTVLNAFAQVEDNLSKLDHYRDAAAQEDEAVKAAKQAVEYSTIRYREGVVNYLEVTTAQTAALEAQRAQVTINTDRLRASVALIRALGGGWKVGDDPMTSVAATDSKPSLN
ncbi:efflux transporter outer membrane subunit [Solimonas marina]|uniref:Efflux transporter outer membrane subunit n=1 Tax=Solimonas marina TaxID=2714601 RepID=A0A969WBL5_9GAMM|nr:efflux transporter outer membrane subunit [Solimonas marina]NKF24167.1 efflux transporter outer membrane subunit [Solimonas marina]